MGGEFVSFARTGCESLTVLSVGNFTLLGGGLFNLVLRRYCGLGESSAAIELYK